MKYKKWCQQLLSKVQRKLKRSPHHRINESSTTKHNVHTLSQIHLMSKLQRRILWSCDVTVKKKEEAF